MRMYEKGMVSFNWLLSYLSINPLKVTTGFFGMKINCAEAVNSKLVNAINKEYFIV